jgi:hypothetical protein
MHVQYCLQIRTVVFANAYRAAVRGPLGDPVAARTQCRTDSHRLAGTLDGLVLLHVREIVPQKF